jgi:hypothetical protein
MKLILRAPSILVHLSIVHVSRLWAELSSFASWKRLGGRADLRAGYYSGANLAKRRPYSPQIALRTVIFRAESLLDIRRIFVEELLRASRD